MSLVDTIHAQLWQQSNDRESTELDQRILALVDEHMPLATAQDREEAVAEVTARVVGLGPLQALANDPTVSEIMINAGSDVWVERAGTLERVDCPVDPTHIEQLIRRLAASGGRRIDRSSPSVDVRLTDGSRLHAILPPLAIDGPALTIRRFSVRHLELAELTTPDQLELLVDAVAKRATIVVAGATSSGKTTLLNALGAHVSHDERLVTIEDAAELRIPNPHVVRLEARLESSTLPAVSIRELVRHALRMRPDRIICGEMRGAEALDLIQAMNTGHRGSLTTVHANSPADALRRIETMMLLGDADLPLRAVREQLAACIDVIVMMGRTEGSGRSVMTVAEVPTRGADDTWSTTTLTDRGAVRNAPSRPWSTRPGSTR